MDFGYIAFFNNSGFCGYSFLSCFGLMLKKIKAFIVFVIIVIIVVIFIFIGVCIIIILSKRARRRRKEVEIVVVESIFLVLIEINVIIGKLVLFSKSLFFKYEDWEAGIRVLFDKERVVGGGFLGIVYRISFEGGVFIVVKKFEILGRIKD